jgi:hypothetical protein
MIYQPSLKREVAQVSGIPFIELAHMHHEEWGTVRQVYCGDNNRLLPEFWAQIEEGVGNPNKGARTPHRDFFTEESA